MDIGVLGSLKAAVAGFALVATQFASPVGAQEPVLIATPSSDWLLEFAEQNCIARRDFASDQGAIFFRLEKSSLDARSKIVLLSTDISEGSGDVTLSVAVEDEFIPLEPVGTMRLGRSFNGAHLYVQLKVDDWSKAGEPTGLKVVDAFESPVILQTGDLGLVLDALDTCVDDLLSGWGLDVELARTSVEPAERLNYNSWAREIIRRAPQRALPRTGRVGFAVRVLIGVDGKPTRCLHDASEDFTDLGDYTCEAMMKRAEYQPARDRDGNTVPSTDTLDFIYYR